MRTITTAALRDPSQVGSLPDAGYNELSEAVPLGRSAECPEISIIIATRNRPDTTAETVRSVLANVGARLEVIVVDQSDDDATWRRLAGRFAAERRLVYVTSGRRGVAAARNFGLALAQADVIAITDDDCLVASDWAARTLQIFRAHPAVDLLYGAVDAIPHDSERAFVPSFCPRARSVESGLAHGGARLKVMGAHMSLRRALAYAIGAFDERFGAGGLWGSAEDCEYHFRALARGHTVLIEPDLRVVHLGVRTMAEAWSLWWRDTRGAGALAAYMSAQGATLVGARFWGELVGRPILRALGNAARLRFPSGIRCVAVLFAGFACGYTQYASSAAWRLATQQSFGQRQPSPPVVARELHQV